MAELKPVKSYINSHLVLTCKDVLIHSLHFPQHSIINFIKIILNTAVDIIVTEEQSMNELIKKIETISM